MCDVLVATPEATRDKVTIFAKNSDREPNESQIVEFIPRTRHPEETVRLTYVEFPQVQETNAVILSRPWWMWGAEMGVNEFGLAIGNTAVFSRVKVPESGITGMDMIRLALERTKSAEEALKFIISIIEAHGQGGSGSHEHKLLYHNAFIIADPNEAWVLETVGRDWAAKQVRDVYSISNAMTIQDDWDMASDGVRKLASGKRNFGFAKHFSDWFYTYFAHGRDRRTTTYGWLQEHKGEITVEGIMGLLRSHRSADFSPQKGSMRDVCMHYGGLTRPSQTASSQISVLSTKPMVSWFTATSTPCLSVFKPVYFEGGLPDLGSPADRYDPESYWWRFEAFHRRFQTDYRKYIEAFSEERDTLQKEILRQEEEIRSRCASGEASADELRGVTDKAFEAHDRLVESWSQRVEPGRFPLLHGFVWRQANRKAGV